MKRKILVLTLALVMAFAPAVATLTSAQAAQKSPYYIRVNCSTCTVTIYATDSQGRRGEPVKAMICSVGKPGRGITPKGTFTLTSYRPQWCHMKDNSYGQYISQFKGNYLFHSVCYNKADPSTLIAEEYNTLGQPASLGCVRLQTGDAKWIYDNCPAGTKVEIFNGTAADDPLGQPEKLLAYLDPDHPNSGWDPTDPSAENPWKQVLAAANYRAQSVDVDGKVINLPMYVLQDDAGDLTNYASIRDVASVLNGTPSQFAVEFFSGMNHVVKTWEFVPSGSEMKPPFTESRVCIQSSVPVEVDGKQVELDSIVFPNPNGEAYTYFQLRDLGKFLGFNVGWSAKRGVYVETGRSYNPDN